MVYQAKTKQRLAAVVAEGEHPSYARIRKKLMTQQDFSEVLFFHGKLHPRECKRIARLFDLDLLIMLRKSTRR